MRDETDVLATILIMVSFLALLAWPFISWVDVITHNTDPDLAKELATHGWNIFVRFFG